MVKREFYNLDPNARFHSTGMPGDRPRFVVHEESWWRRVVNFLFAPTW